MYTTYLKEKLRADRELALSLQKGVAGVSNVTAEQGRALLSGMERLSWYSSCFFDNYQDVCSQLKNEDKRMMLALEQLWNRRDVIFDMIKVFVDLLLKNPSQERILKIRNGLMRIDSSFAASSVSNYAFSFSLTGALYKSFGLRSSLIPMANKMSAGTVFTLSVYGRVHYAARSAEKLKVKHLPYYHLLYGMKVEMLYFLIEDFINMSGYNGGVMDDDKLISIFSNLLR